MENYRDIPGYEGIYSVSDHGNVYSHKTKRVLKLNSADKYKKVGLCKDGTYKSYTIHKLVAMVFLDHIPDGHKQVVDHIDNDPSNNHISNLQLTTHRHNSSKDTNRSLPTGVYRRSNDNFTSCIWHNGQSISLGTYSTIEQASNAYQTYLKSIT